MIAGFYYDQRPPLIDKVPNFYLPNKNHFQKSIGLNLEDILSKNKFINEEVFIFGHFCEIVGPIPLMVYPNKNLLSAEIIDMVVLKAMSVDYQSCEHGDVVMKMSTQSMLLDCSIPSFAHYFTLWDIYARGYVRPCCIIVCCRDKIRARQLFIGNFQVMEQWLSNLLDDNVANFYNELVASKQMIDKLLLLNNNEDLFDVKTFNKKQLIHMQNEYDQLISNIHDLFDTRQLTMKDNSCDLLLDINLAINSDNRELRSVYTIMQITETDMSDLLAIIAKTFNDTTTAESFSLLDVDSHMNMNLNTLNSHCLDHCTKLNFQYFNTASTIDKHNYNLVKSIPLCMCRTMLDNLTIVDHLRTTEDQHPDMLFPYLCNLKASQCQFLSHQCKQLGVSIVTKLIACLFHQWPLIIFVSTQKSYYNLMSFLRLFLPKSHNQNYFICKNNWPKFEQLNESPVIYLNKDAKLSEIPFQLQGYMAIYDYTSNTFVCGPKYSKGHLSNFLDSFKNLEYNHLHLDCIVNVMLLNYVDMIYQYINLLGRRDRRFINEDYLVKLGYSPEDISITEKLALFVLQTLVRNKPHGGNEANFFLISKSLFNLPYKKEK